jgi:hypothetical protein
MQIVDRWFRGWGVVALLALGTTAAMLALRAEPWRVPFVAAHLAALLALAPLGVALVVSTYMQQLRSGRGAFEAVGATLAHDRVATALTCVAFVAAGVSLSQFDGGVRWIRTTANLVTVSAAVTLIVRYLRSR